MRVQLGAGHGAAEIAATAALVRLHIEDTLSNTLAFGLGFPYLVALNALPKPGEVALEHRQLAAQG